MSGFSDYEWERESNEAVRQPYGRPVCSALAGYESAFAKGIPDPCQPTECTNGYARYVELDARKVSRCPQGQEFCSTVTTRTGMLVRVVNKARGQGSAADVGHIFFLMEAASQAEADIIIEQPVCVAWSGIASRHTREGVAHHDLPHEYWQERSEQDGAEGDTI